MIGDPSKDITFHEYQKGLKKGPSNICDVHLYDLRPKSAAYGNMIKGKGFESKGVYTNVQTFFCDVQNIHSVRESFESLMALVLRYCSY